MAPFLLCCGLATARVSPPVIHEPFSSPLPCPSHPQTTLAEEGCGEHQVLAGDRRIDALNAQIFTALRTGSRQADFVAAHTAWFRYRQAYCASVASVNQGGSIAPVDQVLCEAALNQQHITNLRGLLKSLD